MYYEEDNVKKTGRDFGRIHPEIHQEDLRAVCQYTKDGSLEGIKVADGTLTVISAEGNKQISRRL